MAQFIIAYLGGDKPITPEDGKKHFEKYQQWLQSMGEAVVSPANPLKDTHTLAPDGSVTSGTTTTMSGYTVIEADSIEGALEMAASCPFLEINGSLEISELLSMSF